MILIPQHSLFQTIYELSPWTPTNVQEDLIIIYGVPEIVSLAILNKLNKLMGLIKDS